MGTKINPLDWGRVTKCNIDYNTEKTVNLAGNITVLPSNISMTVEITMLFEDEEELSIIEQAMLDNINKR